jgi:hypothetical protein
MDARPWWMVGRAGTSTRSDAGPTAVGPGLVRLFGTLRLVRWRGRRRPVEVGGGGEQEFPYGDEQGLVSVFRQATWRGRRASGTSIGMARVSLSWRWVAAWAGEQGDAELGADEDEH